MRTVGRRAYECRYENKKTNKAADKNKQPTDNRRQCCAAPSQAALRCVALPPSPICNFNFACFLFFLLSPLFGSHSICIIKVKVVKKWVAITNKKVNCKLLGSFCGKGGNCWCLSPFRSLSHTLCLPLSFFPSLALPPIIDWAAQNKTPKKDNLKQQQRNNNNNSNAWKISKASKKLITNWTEK